MSHYMGKLYATCYLVGIPVPRSSEAIWLLLYMAFGEAVTSLFHPHLLVCIQAVSLAYYGQLQLLTSSTSNRSLCLPFVTRT